MEVIKNQIQELCLQAIDLNRQLDKIDKERRELEKKQRNFLDYYDSSYKYSLAHIMRMPFDECIDKLQKNANQKFYDDEYLENFAIHSEDEMIEHIKNIEDKITVLEEFKKTLWRYDNLSKPTKLNNSWKHNEFSSKLHKDFTTKEEYDAIIRQYIKSYDETTEQIDKLKNSLEPVKLEEYKYYRLYETFLFDWIYMNKDKKQKYLKNFKELKNFCNETKCKLVYQYCHYISTRDEYLDFNFVEDDYLDSILDTLPKDFVAMSIIECIEILRNKKTE